MRQAGGAAALAFLGLALAATAAAQTPSGTVGLAWVDPDRLRADLEGGYDPQASTLFRREMDRLGDGDGNVSVAEAEAFAARLLESRRAAGAALSVGRMRLLLDGREPAETRFELLGFTGAAGPAASNATLGVRERLDLVFEVSPAAQRHRLLVDSGNLSRQGFVPWAATGMTLAAPAGWRLSIAGREGVQADADGKEVAFAPRVLARTAPPIEVLLERQAVPVPPEPAAPPAALPSTRPAPGVPSALAAAALLAAALCLQRGSDYP